MRKLVSVLGPTLGVGLLLSCLFTTPATALELAMGGTFYVCVLEGECPQPIDLWGVGPGRNPLFLGHYQGHVNKRPPIFMGSYKPGQELYIWHETNDPATGERRSQDIKSPEAYSVGVDPRGGYLIELKGGTSQTEPALKMWIYPARPPVAITPGAGGDKPQVADAVGSVVVNGQSAATMQTAGAAAGPAATPPAPADARHADPLGGWQWPALQVAIAMLLFVSYRRSRQVALAAGEVGQVSIGEVDVQSFGRPEDPSSHAFQAASAAAAASAHASAASAAAAASVAAAAMSDDPAVMFGANGPASTPAPLAGPAPHGAPAPSAPAQASAPRPAEFVSAHDERDGTDDIDELTAASGWQQQPAATSPADVPHAASPSSSSSSTSAASGAVAHASPAPGTGKAAAAHVAITRTAQAAPSAGSTAATSTAAPGAAGSSASPASAPTAAAASSRATARAAVTPPPRAHFAARAPAGWAPLPADHPSAATRALPPPRLPDRGATMTHQPTHTASATGSPARPAASAHAEEPTDGLLEALGRRRPMGLPLAFVTPRAGKRSAPATASPASSAGVVAVTRALASAFHDLELVHADEECVILSGLDLALRRRVSVHALSPVLARDEKLAAQFVREAQEFAGLSHRGLLRIHRVVAEPIPHLVAEPLPGQPLSAALTSGEPMPLSEVLAAGAHLTEALDYLHQRGMVHGDLRPSRVAGGFHHELRLCPPLFAQIPLDALAARGLQCGERRVYRAPEAAAGATSDYRGDIHAVGLVLHHMITGALPPHASDEDESDDAFRYRAGVPEQLMVLIRRCLQGDPGRRYQDCGIARQMLDAMFREHGARERVVLACLPGLARVLRNTLQPLGALLLKTSSMSTEQLSKEVVAPAWRDLVRSRLLGTDGGLISIGVLLERAHGLRRWAQEASLLAIVERLGRMAIELAGLATLIESGGPRHPAVADRARTELIRLGEDIAEFEHAVQGEITARLVDFAGVVKDAVGVSTSSLNVETHGVPSGLRGLFAEPATVRLQLVTAISTTLAAGRTAGATRARVHGAFEDGFKRIVITVADDGRGIPAPIVRPPLAIVPRLTRPSAPGEAAMPRDLEHAFEAVERVGGRVMVTNRTGAPGVELRIELPSNLC